MTVEIVRTIYTKEQIYKEIQKAADKINKDYAGKEPTLICLLKGSANFTQEISKRLNMEHRIAYILAKSYYGGAKNTGKTEILSEVDFDIEGHDVIIMEDIIDSGNTLKNVIDHLNKKNNFNSLKVYTLLEKKAKREVEIDVEYSCFDVENVFLLGFGLDYDEKFRNLQFIAEAKEVKKEG
jgi:hypoxanthine phosphoribosyltransferase